MMFPSRFLLPTVVAYATSAQGFDLGALFARQTNVPRRTAGLPPDAQITPGPSVAPELLRRDSYWTALVAPDNTCGFLNGENDNPWMCGNSAYSCAIITTSSPPFGRLGCCSSGVCGIKADCVNGGAGLSTRCGAACQSDTETVKCTGGASTLCGSVDFGNGVHDFFCATSGDRTFVTASTTYFGQLGRFFSTSSYAADFNATGAAGQTSTTASSVSTSSSRGPTSTPTTPTTTPAVSSTPDTNLVTVTPSPTPTPAPVNNGSSSTNTGAIAGGVVGGVAVLALVGLAVWLVRRRDKKRNGNNNNNIDNGGHNAPSAYGQHPGGGGGPQPPPQQWQQQQWQHPQHPEMSAVVEHHPGGGVGGWGAANELGAQNKPTPYHKELEASPTGTTDPGTVSVAPYTSVHEVPSPYRPDEAATGAGSPWAPPPPAPPPAVASEAGGDAVGVYGRQEHHRGQFHELS
ncbi:uncharacterized protein B0I36DRAFT_382547 [Microdochium trichocladiopsis]|uniref:Uncharacterized protein n=1 Tax=Microdochium trichocladiopsis TaxID=1682393 RepID=A0A9P8YF97_9PEZI|nr:uncharacterized protein B0I36DRAFT_382547 [Microdochium trichocladiopsis]KAH7035937.1 hypothetical protein B0I36DRAFT_382547 [Microdochium trichocladiopsis]